MWKCLMHWIKSYSNYRWWIRKPMLHWGICLSRHLQVLATSFPDHFPTDWCGRVKEGLLLWQTSQAIKSNGSLPEGGSTGENILRLPKGCQGCWEGRFHWVAPKLQNPNCWWPPKPRTTIFFPLRKLKGNQPLTKKPAAHLAHLEEEDVGDGKEPESDDPSGIKGVTEEFVVWLARAVKDASKQMRNSCYHCSSPEHFIHNCLLVKTSRDKKQLNRKEGMALTKGAWTPPITMSGTMKSPQAEAPEA